MAKQNFLSGGYYGKLGVTVGQRWKNIRTIRSYVIPANPRTEKQQANRGQFGGAVQKSQLAMQMNYNATCFEHTDFSRWNYRMRTARELQDASMLDLDLIPLYPTNFVPPFLISSFEISDISTQGRIVFAVTGNLPTSDRVLSVLFHLYDEYGVEVGYKLYVGNYEVANPGYITVEVDNNSEINDNCYVRLVSRDDEDSENDMVASGMLQVTGSSYDERDFDVNILSITKSLTGVTVVFAEPYKDFISSSFTGSVYAVSAGSFVTVSGSSLTLINSGGYFAVEIPCSFTKAQEILAFPSGAYVTVTDIDAEGSNFHYTKSNETVNFDDDDLSRNVDSYTIENDNMYDTIRFKWSMGSTSGVSSQNVACVVKSTVNPSATAGVATSMVLYAYDSETIMLSSNDNRRTYKMASGDWVTFPSMTFAVNGVTYNIAGEEQVAFTNSRTITYLTKTNCPYTFIGSHSYSSGDYVAEGQLTLTNWAISNPEDITISASVTGSVVTNSQTLTADLDNYGEETTLVINLNASASSNLGKPTEFSISAGNYRAFTYNGINYYLDFNNVTWNE